MKDTETEGARKSTESSLTKEEIIFWKITTPANHNMVGYTGGHT
jgi:hypothetical protein